MIEKYLRIREESPDAIRGFIEDNRDFVYDHVRQALKASGIKVNYPALDKLALAAAIEVSITSPLLAIKLKSRFEPCDTDAISDADDWIRMNMKPGAYNQFMFLEKYNLSSNSDSIDLHYLSYTIGIRRLVLKAFDKTEKEIEHALIRDFRWISTELKECEGSERNTISDGLKYLRRIETETRGTFSIN